MTLNHNVWSPDTCGCTINYYWDTAEPPDNRHHRYLSEETAALLLPDDFEKFPGGVRAKRTGWVFAEKVCKDHRAAGLSGPDLHRALFQENRRKNYVTGFVIPQVRPDIKPDQVSHSHTSDRVLHLAVPALQASEKARIQSVCDVLYGKGMAVID